MDEPQLTKVTCPSCGTPLLFGAGVISMRCQFCNAVVERPLQPDQPATLKSGPARRPQSDWPPHAAPANTSTAFRGVAVFLGILLGVGVALMVVLLVVQNAGTSGFDLGVTGPAAALSTDRTEGPDFIVFGYNSPGESYLLARLDPIARKVVWRGKRFEDIGDVRTIVVDGEKFFTVEGRDLHAYSAADGSELWLARLSDELGYCDECLSVADGRAVTLTQDYVIQAFDVETGIPAWKRRMDGYTNGFAIADGGLWVIDKVDDRYELLQLDLADGDVLTHVESECVRQDGYVTSTLSASSMFFLDPDGAVRSPERSMYLLYGWNPACVERWDPAAGTRTWQTEDDRGYSPSNDFTSLSTPETLFFADDNILWSVSKADGQTRVVLEDEDHYLIPLALEQGVLILRTKRTRGTSVYALRGVDPESGGTLWEHEIEDAEPLEPPDAAFPHVDEDESIWSWRMIDGRIRLSIFQAHPNQITFVTIDPKNGSTSDAGTLKLNFSYDESYFGPEVVLWRESVVWFVADSKLVALDISAAKVLYQFP